MDPNLWGVIKTVLRGELTALGTCTGKEAAYEISNLSFHLRKLEKNNRREEIIKTRAETNEIQNRKTTEKSIKPKVCSLKKSIKMINL